MRQTSPFLPHIGAIVLIVAAFLLLYSPIRSAPFWAVDEWEVLQFSSPTLLHPQIANFRSGMAAFGDYTAYIERDFAQEGRFRPMWHALRFTEAALFGHDAAAWRAGMLAIGSLTLVLLYAAARTAGLGWISALLIAFWLLTAGHANEIWLRVGPNETGGMLFLACALIAAMKASARSHANRWDMAMLLGLALASLSKESFVLTIPAILFARVTLSSYRLEIDWRTLVHRLWVILVAGLGGMALLLGLTWLASRNGGWGANVVGLSLQSFLPWNWLANLGIVAPLMLYFLPAFLTFVIAPNLPRAHIAGPWVLVGFAAFGLWAVPQLILYSNTLLAGRFLYPLLAGVSALNGWGVDTLLRRRLWLLVIPLLAITTAVLGRQAVDQYNLAGRMATQATAFDTMIRSAANAAGERAIVIAADPALVPEWICALPSLLGAQGVTNALYLEPVLESGDVVADQFTGYLTRCLGASFIGTAALDAPAVGAIILLSSPEGWAANAPGWYDPAAWALVEHAQVFETLRFNPSAPPLTVSFWSLEPAER